MVEDSGFKASGRGYSFVKGSLEGSIRVWGRISEFKYRVWGFGFRVSGFGHICSRVRGHHPPPPFQWYPPPPMAPTPATLPSPCCCADLPLLQIGGTAESVRQ